MSKLRLILISILLTLFLTTTLTWIYRSEVIKFIRYFPNYNPFEPAITVEYKSLVSQNFTSKNFNYSSLDIKSTAPKPAASSESSLYKVQLPFDSGNRKLIVYIPKGYDTTPLPLLILLHGSPGRETDWVEAGKARQTLDRMINSGEISPLIVAFPDGNGGENRDTQFINSNDGKELNEDWITKDVVDFCQKQFNTRREISNRAIGGLSSGGFGAMNLGLKHQDIFGSILSFSGYGDIEQNAISNELIQNNRDIIYSNSPNQYLNKLSQKSVRIWMTVGQQDGDFLPKNRKLYKDLTDNKFEATFVVRPGVHAWNLWADSLPDGLKWLNLK